MSCFHKRNRNVPGTHVFKHYGSQWSPKTGWFPTFFKIPYFWVCSQKMEMRLYNGRNSFFWVVCIVMRHSLGLVGCDADCDSIQFFVSSVLNTCVGGCEAVAVEAGLRFPRLPDATGTSTRWRQDSGRGSLSNVIVRLSS